jgi:hypothetical protein
VFRRSKKVARELGNEQYNEIFVEQVADMAAKVK